MKSCNTCHKMEDGSYRNFCRAFTCPVDAKQHCINKDFTFYSPDYYTLEVRVRELEMLLKEKLDVIERLK